MLMSSPHVSKSHIYVNLPCTCSRFLMLIPHDPTHWYHVGSCTSIHMYVLCSPPPAIKVTSISHIGSFDEPPKYSIPVYSAVSKFFGAVLFGTMRPVVLTSSRVKFQFVLKLIQLVTSSILFSLKGIQKFQHCQLCVFGKTGLRAC